MEALDGFYLTRPFVLGTLLTENPFPMAITPYPVYAVSKADGEVRHGPMRSYGVPRNLFHPASQRRPWIAFVSVFLLFKTRYYPKTKSPKAIGSVL